MSGADAAGSRLWSTLWWQDGVHHEALGENGSAQCGDLLIGTLRREGGEVV